MKLTKKLEKFTTKLERAGFKKKAFTGNLLSLKKKCKINIYSSGKTIIVTKEQRIVDELKKELNSILYEDMQSD